MLTLISVAKLITEVALLSLAGQWVVGMLAGERSGENFIYQLLGQVSKPFVVLAGKMSPQRVLPRHHPWVAFLVLALAWLALTVFKIAHCLEIGVQLCR
jgi:hypothetical protein